MKRIDAWMPLYIGDYMADTSRLTTEQHGAYLLLLMDYWRNGAPPDDEAVLASISKLPLSQWRKVARVLGEFFIVANGRWTQKRAEHEREQAAAISAKRRSAGKQGAASRWCKQAGNDHGKAMANAMANASQNDAPSPSPSSLPAVEKRAHKRSNVFDAADIDLPGWLDRALWNEWVAERKVRGKAITERAAKQQLVILDEYRVGGHMPERVIRHAIANGNQGLYPPPRIVAANVPSASKHQEVQATDGKHAGFASKDYRQGIAADGTLA
jgi:uncharacterized protein YdaU (DUF1376 family)